MSTTSVPRPITEIATDLGIAREHLVPYGDDKAKIRLAAREADGAFANPLEQQIVAKHLARRGRHSVDRNWRTKPTCPIHQWQPPR